MLNRDILYEIASDAENKKYQDLRTSVLSRNSEFFAFDILRSGDDITLVFGLRRNGVRADFRLLGNKHDLYRMAMGVRIDETFRILAQGDPNIEPVEVKEQDRDLTLVLRYPWPKEADVAVPTASPARPAPAPPAAPPRASAGEAPPPRRELRRERAVQAPPEEDPERNPKYFVPAKRFPGDEGAGPAASEAVPGASPPAPGPQTGRPDVAEPPPPAVATQPAPPAPPPVEPATPQAPPSGVEAEVETPEAGQSPLALAPSVKVAEAPPREPDSGEAYQRAVQTGSPEALESFASAHPDAPQAAEARRRAQELLEEADYQAAKAADGAPAFREFLAKHPGSLRTAEIEARLTAAEAQTEREQADGQAREEADARRKDALEAARRLDNATAYRMFLAAYPDAPEASDVWTLLKTAEADDAAFGEGSGSAEGLLAYVAMHPKGRHVEDARQRLAAIRKAAADEAFRDAEAAGTAEALSSFLKAWPASPKAAEARAALDAIRKVKGAPAVKPTEGTLVAAYSASVPVLNGRDNDAVWQSAQVLEVPLTGGNGTTRSVRIRATHDGKNLYLLAQWSDGGRDIQYRPWVWDAGRKSYQQGSQVDDAFAVSMYRGKGPADSCMLRGLPQEADVWLWRAFWSEISGLAEDETIRVSAERTPKANPYSSQAGQGQVWIREDPDAGTPGWSFSIPVEYQGAVVPSYRKAEASGSRSDVRTGGLWNTGTWSVEFARALDTKHPDDVPLRERGTFALSFAAYDHAEKEHHAASGVVRLEIRGR